MVGKISALISQKNSIELINRVQNLDLQPHLGVVTLGSGVRMWMQTLQGNYGPNMNAFW